MLYNYYSHSHIKALLQVYPEVNFKQHRFSHVSSILIRTINIFTYDFIHENYWSEESNKKLFFDDFAASNNFDPLIAKNWYSVKHSELEDFGVLDHIWFYFSDQFVGKNYSCTQSWHE